MAGGMAKIMATIAVAVMMLINGVDSKTLVVGDENGWSFPALSTFYQDWAAKQNFLVNDTLVFNFTTNVHTVGILTSLEAYDNCETTLVTEVISTGPYERSLNSSGQFYFICTIGNHCSLGLKFSANISATVASGPTSA